MGTKETVGITEAPPQIVRPKSCSHLTNPLMLIWVLIAKGTH